MYIFPYKAVFIFAEWPRSGKEQGDGLSEFKETN
jgi:hypothetical protein